MENLTTLNKTPVSISMETRDGKYNSNQCERTMESLFDENLQLKWVYMSHI